MYVYKDGGTHALVAEAREDLERGSAEVRVEQVRHLLHGCGGMSVERYAHSLGRRRARTIESGCWEAFVCCALHGESSRGAAVGSVMNYRPDLASSANVAAVKLAARACFAG